MAEPETIDLMVALKKSLREEEERRERREALRGPAVAEPVKCGPTHHEGCTCYTARVMAIINAANSVLRHFPPTSLNPKVILALDIHDLRLALAAWRGEEAEGEKP